MSDLAIHHTPIGYMVFDSEQDGIAVSAAYDDRNTAAAFVAGYVAAEERFEELEGE